ncbi:MAG: T9SS type A sorting domain-containing protein, partial [Bacteroidales bacterium]|nr:T9SS type A sorting domain-containing protein [Bacteroidales bacterium]
VLSGLLGLPGLLTVNDELYNDNQPAGKSRAETIAAWDFEDTGQTDIEGYTADDGIAANIDLAQLSLSGNVREDDFYTKGGGSRAPFADRFFRSSTYGGWVVQISTEGYQNMVLSSQQYISDLDGPATWKIQWSTDNITWNDVTGGDYTIAAGTWNDLSGLVLPADINNQPVVFIQWLYHTGTSSDESGIDNIIITGEEIPPPPTGILIQSTANGTGSLIHNNDVEATIERYIPAVASNSVYHLVSVPLTQAADPRSGLFEWSYLFNFDVPTQEWVAMGTSLYNPLYVDQGYMIYKYPGPAKWETDTTYSFAGPMNNGAFACNVAFPGKDDNHNLVPNPYPSAIDWDATSGWTKSNVNNAIWIWNPVSGNYASWIANVSNNGGSRYIPVGQSFFVSASAAAPALSMTNDVRVHNDQAFLKNKQELPDLLRVKALANNFSDEAVVRFADGATAGFDGQYDASKFYGSPEAPQLFTMSSDDKQLSINTMEVGTGKRIVDLGFTLEAAGLCILNFSGIESFNSDMQIHLNDRVTGQTINLRTTPEYSFAHSPENAALRFELIFDGVTAIADAKPVNQDFFYVDGKLYLNFAQDSQGPFNVTVYNINGQTEFLGVAHEARAVVDLAGLTSGFHIVRVVTNDYSGEKKVVVK